MDPWAILDGDGGLGMIPDLKPYPAYKDSGVPWLGQVPEGWEVARCRYVFRGDRPTINHRC